jgi:tRNA dimethylallyltransferase
MKYDLIAVVGPTASGKTSLAVALAKELDTEIISADSRQVYRRMDLGTGKDLSDYHVEGDRYIPYHLIDIVEPGTKYNVFEYQQDFMKVYEDMKSRELLPVLCGGTGMYVEAILKGFNLIPVPENKALREQLSDKTLQELAEILSSYKNLHNVTDLDTTKRAIRAIEIEEYKRTHQVEERPFPKLNALVVGIDVDRDTRRERITRRLKQRLEDGMLDEIRGLLAEGIPADDLIYYGLEYKFLTQYIIGELSYDDMFRKLEIAIHQFAKRQMTWFRGMEKRGIPIYWLPEKWSMEEKLKTIMQRLSK